MAKIKYDGVITAVHFNPDKQVDWVRAFLRCGPQFSDRIMLDRQTRGIIAEGDPTYLRDHSQNQAVKRFFNRVVNTE